MPIPLIDIALTLVTVIVEVRRKSKIQDETVSELLDRIEAIEKPLRVLQGKVTESSVYDTTLFQLVRTLESTEAVLMQFVGQSKTKRLLKVLSYQDKFKALKLSVDSCIVDLQMALQVEEVAGKDKATVETAKAIIDAMEASRLSRSLETVLRCVQCGKDFKESENAEGSCAYHPVAVRDLGSEFVQFPDEGCARGKHSAVHHQRFEYVNFLGHVRHEIMEHDAWITVSQHDSSPDSEGAITANFGRLRNGQLALWFVQFGTPIAITSFDEVDIEAPTHFGDGFAPIMNQVNQNKTPFDSKRNRGVKRAGKTWFAKGFWKCKAGQVCGVRVEVKSPSSETANVSEIEIDIDPLTPGKVKVLFDDRKSAVDIAPEAGKNYVLPAAKSNFKQFPPHAFKDRGPLPTFEQEGDLKVRIKAISPIKGNPDGSQYRADNFKAELMLISTLNPTSTSGSTREERMAILNMVKDMKITVNEAERLLNAVENSASGDEPITIVSIAVEASLDMGKTWIPADGVEVSHSVAGGGGFGPFDVLRMESREVVKMNVLPWFWVEGKKRGWTGRVFLARDVEEFVMVKVTVEEALGKKASLVLPYRNGKVEGLEVERDGDFLFVGLDDVDDESRSFVRISPPPKETTDDENRVLFVVQQYNGVTTTHSVTPANVRVWIEKAKVDGVKWEGVRAGRFIPQNLRAWLEKNVEEVEGVVMRIEELSGSRFETVGHFFEEGGRGFLWGLWCRVLGDDEGKVFNEGGWVLKREIFL
ncbi:hypothetical protein HDU97_002736 [Phlyctochytrium planicorne]|nr:hypothetical protein HDU97_002736 [Phlyctochytrium planicorne]